MADRKNLIIVLQIPVADEAAAKTILNTLRTKLADQVDIVMTAKFDNSFDLSP